MASLPVGKGDLAFSQASIPQRQGHTGRGLAWRKGKGCRPSRPAWAVRRWQALRREDQRGAVISDRLASVSGIPSAVGLGVQIGERDRSATQGLIGETGTAVRSVVVELELGIEVGEVLLHGRFADEQFTCHLTNGSRFGEQVAIQQWTAEDAEHVPLAGGERRRFGPRLGDRPRQVCAVAEDEAHLAHSHLVTVAQPAKGEDSLPVEERAIGGTEIGYAPAGRKPLEDGVKGADGGVIGERYIVRRILADRHPVPIERHDRPARPRPKFKLRLHHWAYYAAGRSS